MQKPLLLTIVILFISIVANSQVVYIPNDVLWSPYYSSMKYCHVEDIDGDIDIYLNQTTLGVFEPGVNYLFWKENTTGGFESRNTITRNYYAAGMFGEVYSWLQYSHQFLDIDDDGDDDLLSIVRRVSGLPDVRTSSLRWSESMGDGVFEHKDSFVYSETSLLFPFGGAISYHVIDIDNDEFIDLMVNMKNDTGHRFISWYEFDSINFHFVDTLFASAIPISKIADINNDQFEDIIQNDLTWLKNDGNGNFMEMGLISNLFPEFNYWYQIDIDSDDDIDFVFVDSLPKIYQMLNDGTGQFAAPQLIYEFSHNADTRIRHFEDIDQDDDMDIILYNTEDDLAILYNQDNHIYGDILPITTLFGDPRALKIADFNGDNELDILLLDLHRLYYYGYYDSAIDTIPPVANCYHSIIKYLSNEGIATIEPSNIDSSSYDDYFIQSYILSDTEVDCEDVGITRLVDLLVIDYANDTSICTTIVQTFDTIKPILVCQDISFEIALGDTIYITFDSIATVTDNCGIVTQEISQSEFYVSDAIDYQVEVFVEDEHGNTCICNSTVTIDILTNSIINKSDISLRLFPNPMSKSINLQLHINNISPYDVKVYDSKGRLVHQVANSLERNLEIEGAWLAAGAYSFVVSDHDTNEILGSSKIIVR